MANDYLPLSHSLTLNICNLELSKTKQNKTYEINFFIEMYLLNLAQLMRPFYKRKMYKNSQKKKKITKETIKVFT